MSEYEKPAGVAAPLIRNCRFAFRCSRQWEELALTSALRMRFCDTCKRRVVLCARDDELREALLHNDCVAIPVSLLTTDTDIPQRDRNYVGQLTGPYG